MTNPIRNKAEFDQWFGDIISDLNLNSGSRNFSAGNLAKVHWNRIWKIYDKCKLELPTTRTKETQLVWETSSYEAKLIILEAHGTDESKFMQREIMEHYMNSGNYD